MTESQCLEWANNLSSPDRITHILSLLEREWRKRPEQRLCQILSNVAAKGGWHNEDLFHYPDSDLQGALEKYSE